MKWGARAFASIATTGHDRAVQSRCAAVASRGLGLRDRAISRWRVVSLLLAVGTTAGLLVPVDAQVPANNLPLLIGRDQRGENIFHGKVGAVRIYGRELKSDELKSSAALQPGASSSLPNRLDEWLRPKLPLIAAQTFAFPRAWTVEAWIQPDPGSNGRIVDQITPGGSDGFLLDILPGNALRLIVGNDVVQSVLPETNGWTHVAATCDESGVLGLFVNGRTPAVEGGEETAVTLTGSADGPTEPLTLWYRRPARRWTEAVLIGNGRLGGMIWGGVAQERIDLNEDTLWSGEPYDNLNTNGLKSLPEIRRLLIQEKNQEAQRLVERDMNGRYNQSYQPLGDLILDFPLTGEVRNYRRELNLDEAMARVQFEHQNVHFTREVFASHPAQAIVVRLSSDQPGKISFTASLGSLLHHAKSAERGFLKLTGHCPAHVDPSYAGKAIVWEDGPDGKGMRFETRLLPMAQGGRLTVSDDGIAAEGCDSVTLILVAATSFNGPQKSPSREGKDPAALCDQSLEAIGNAPYPALRAAHVTDHQRLFHRVTLDLGHSEAEKRPSDLRLMGYRPGEDPALAALYYQFGRYLLIASSRPGTQPANLQGIWNHEMQPPWSANWTLNCNAQINYWPVETANLAECHLPLLDLTEELSVDGAHIAQALYGARGWVAHHNTDIWRQAGPVSGSALWSIFQVGGAWLCHHLWEHYAFSGDPADLRRVWPTLQGAARFYLDSLIEEPTHGWLVTGPDTNFENTFRKPNGETGSTCLGPTGSMEIIRELLQNCLQASRLLGTNPELRAEIERVLPRLPPLQISPTTGELQEWIQDWQRTAECQVLSSWGAVCGTQITPRGTPELAAGLRKIFDQGQWWKRGLVGSWQGAFQANVYARLGDGDTALQVLDTHLRRSVNPNFTAHFKNAGAEFEIDGNLGQTAAVGEMLLQSHTGELELLPALPKAWASGRVTGLRARGGFTVDIEWKGDKVTAYRIAAKEARAVKVRVNGEVKTINAEPLQARSLRGAAAGLLAIGVGASDRIPERPVDWPLLTTQFAAVTPENCLKPNPVQVKEGDFNFTRADAFVEFATSNRLSAIGHCLVWAKDDRTPPWFFRDGTNTASPDLLLERMRQHIQTVVGRYRGRIKAWDVVNEALDDGTNFLRPSGWSAACGEDFVAKAFQFAHAADPEALLIYNDYNNELPAKREKLIRLVRSLQARSVPIHAVGLQGHYELDRVPLEEIEATLIAMRELGVKVVVSELDIDVIPRGRWWAEGGKYREELAKVDPYRAGCPPEILRRQADQYAALFRMFRKHADVLARVSFWNLHDGQSWLNEFPWKRVNHPLLFDREGKPKPAFDAVIEALNGGR